MSGIEDWCIFDKLSPPKLLCQPHILNPSAQLLSHCPQYGLLAFTQGPTITLTTVPALVQWTKGGELLPKYEAQVESINNATHIVLGSSGKVVAIGAGDDLIIMKTKGIIDGASTNVIAKLTLVSPIHYLEVSGDDKVLVLTKAGSVSVVVSGQKRDLQYANVQSCCFSVTDRELVLALPGTFMLLSAGDFSVIQTCPTDLSSQIIGIRQVNPDFWAFVGIDTDKNTECFVINHTFFTGQRFEDSVCYHQGDDGSLNPLRPPQGYDLSALHCAYIQPLPERNCFLFCSTVSTTIEVVYFLSDSHTYARFETETSKIKGPLGFMMQENRRFDILCRGLVLVRSTWDTSARFTYHYIDEDFDLPSQPLVLAMGMTGEVVSMRLVDLREEFCQKETVKPQRPLAEIPDLAAALPASSSNLSLLNPNKPEKPTKQPEGIFSAFKLPDSKPGTSLFPSNPPKEEAKSASKFPLPALDPAPTTSSVSFNPTNSVFSSATEAKKEEGASAAKKSLLDVSKPSENKPLASLFAASSLGKEEAKQPSKSENRDLQGREEAKAAKSSAGPLVSPMPQGAADMPGPDSYERQETALYQYVHSQLQDLKDSISRLAELTSNPTLNESNTSAFTIKVKDLRNTVETDKSALERLNGPLKKLQQDQACNKLEFESLKHIKKQGLLRSLDQLLPAKMGKKLKMMEKRVVLLQEYEGAFKVLHEQQNARLESLLGPRITGIRQNTGPRALSRFNAPLKSSPSVVISSHKAANLIISAVQAIRHRLLAVASKLVKYQDKFRPAKQEKRFDFNEVEDMELSSDEEDSCRGERLAYKPAEAHRDFEEAVQRAQRERLEEAKDRSASALTPLMRTPSEKDKGRLSVKPVQPLRIDFKVGAGPTQTISAQLEQFDALVKEIRTQGKPGDEGKGGQSGPFGAISAAKTSQFEGFEGSSGASADTKPAGLFGSAQGKTGVQEGKAGLFSAATEAKPGLFAAPVEGKPGPLTPAEAKPAATASQPSSGLFAATPLQKSSFFVSAKEGAAVSSAKPGFSTPSPSETNPAPSAFNPQPAPTAPTSPFFVSAKPGSDAKPMFSSFAPNPSPIATGGNTGFGGLSAFSKPSIPTALGGFSTANQGGGFKAVMEASSSSFAMFQNTQATTFMQQAPVGAAGFKQGQAALTGTSDLFKPRK